jgi:hypothetical protein
VTQAAGAEALDAAALESAGAERLRAAESTDQLAEAEAAILGKRSPLALARAALGALEHEERKRRGSQLNDVRTKLSLLAEERRPDRAPELQWGARLPGPAP